MKEFSIQVITSLLLSSVQAMSVYRSDGKQNKGDRFYGFGNCDGTSAFQFNDGCKCNGATTFYMDDNNTQPLCYSNQGIQTKTGCNSYSFDGKIDGKKREFSAQSNITKIQTIELWDTQNKGGFWNEKWMNELKKFITKEGKKVKVDTENANFEGLLIRIGIEVPLTLGLPLLSCFVIKVKGNKTYPLTWQSIFPNSEPPTTAQTPSTTTIQFTNVQQTTVTSTKIKTPPVAKENTTSSPLNSEASTSTPLIVGIVLAILVLLLLVFIFCFIRRKRLKKQKHKRIELQNNQPIYQEYDVSLREIDAKQEDEDAHNKYAYTYNSTTDMLKTKTPTFENNDYGYAYNNPKDLKAPLENSDLQESNYYSPVISDEQAEQPTTEIPEYAAVNKERK